MLHDAHHLHKPPALPLVLIANLAEGLAGLMLEDYELEDRSAANAGEPP